MNWERTGASGVTVAPALVGAHWCQRCENQHCYSRTGRTVTVALVREPALLQAPVNWERTGASGARTSTVTVALVREPALLQAEPTLLQSHWYARTSTIAEQYWSLPWDRQAVTVTLRAALTTRHGTSAGPVLMVMQGKKPKVAVQLKWRTVPALTHMQVKSVASLNVAGGVNNVWR